MIAFHELVAWFDDWIATATVALGCGALAWVLLRFVLDPLLRRIARPHEIARSLLDHAASAARMVLVLFVIQLVLSLAPDELEAIGPLRLGTQIAMLVALTWFGVSSVRGVAAGVIALHPLDAQDNLRARQVVTQTRVLANIAVFFVGAIGASLVLMTFPSLRQVGTSLLASAGVAGIVAGFAARSVLSNLMAGLQLALTQPIRLDDVLIVAGEWGRVEEIRGTYVVMRIWDERRLIVPLQWFIENPFENWTRSSAQILGTVFLRLDYRTPLEPLRNELQRIVASAPEWDKRVAKVQVTDADDRTIHVRFLVSAASSGEAFELRCLVRESMIDFIQREYPDCLPRIRADTTSAPQAPGARRPEYSPQVAGLAARLAT